MENDAMTSNMVSQLNNSVISEAKEVKSEEQINNEMVDAINLEELIEIKAVNIDSVIDSFKKKALEKMQKISCDKVFEELQEIHLKNCINYCEERLSNARNIDVMKAELVERFDKTLPDLETLPFALKNGLECFISHYNTNYQFERAFSILAGNFYEIFYNEIPYTAHEYLVPIPFNEKETELLEQYPEDMVFFLALALRKIVYANLLKHLQDPSALQKEISPKNNAFKWNVTKNNKTEFVQLFYALHKAGYIEGEITKVIEASAVFFNLELSEHWQSNLSANIHRFIKQPVIFDNLKKAYTAHSDKLQQVKYEKNKGKS